MVQFSVCDLSELLHDLVISDGAAEKRRSSKEKARQMNPG
jgi:hypothetical protein